MATFTSPLTYLILVSLAAAAAAYAWGYVRPLRRRHRNHGQTALLVVIGDALVALAAILIVAASGPVDALGLAALLTACLTAGGLPMIAEYIDDHTSRSADADQRQAVADIQRLLQED